MSATPDAAPPSPTPSSRAFDRTAAAILGTMVTLIVLLTALLVTTSAPNTADPAPTAQTAASPHRG
jgi:hypothetical protein